NLRHAPGMPVLHDVTCRQLGPSTHFMLGIRAGHIESRAMILVESASLVRTARLSPIPPGERAGVAAFVLRSGERQIIGGGASASPLCFSHNAAGERRGLARARSLGRREGAAHGVTRSQRRNLAEEPGEER